MGLHPLAALNVDALQLLSTGPATEGIPVIALITSALPRDAEASLAAGFFSHLKVPVSADAFAHSLALAFSLTPAPGQFAAATENT